MKHYSIRLVDINGNSTQIPYYGGIDRADLESLYRTWDSYATTEDTSDVLYEIQESVGGENYFRIENGVHVPM